MAADTAASVSGTLCGLSDPPELVETDKSDYRVLCSGRPGAPDERAADDTAWLFYTSGTTGRPKGAMLSHRNLFTMTAGYFVDVDRVEPTDAILHAAPMSHGSGLYILPHVAAGAAQVVPESGGFDASEVFELSTQYPGATLFAPPTLVRRLVDHADAGAACPSGLKTVVCGGGPMYVADCRRALEVLGPRLAQIYGQGESPMTITSMAKAQFPSLQDRAADEILASVGFPQALVDVAVVDDEDRAVPRGEPGEVVVRGDCVMSGYWRDPAASADTLRGGWLHTGDIGVLGARGQLLLKDRSKDLIISGGSNIYPREVEEILLLHPAVLEASVVGRVHRDWGEEVVAFVVARPREPSLEDELDALCRAHIARFKRPRDYRFVSELPKNNYGKVLKTVLREAMS